MSRKNIAIKDDLHGQVKVKATIRGLSMAKAVEEALVNWVGDDKRHIQAITGKLSAKPS
jgi:hypothetical protein